MWLKFDHHLAVNTFMETTAIDQRTHHFVEPFQASNVSQEQNPEDILAVT
jgi:hypothetical protein